MADPEIGSGLDESEVLGFDVVPEGDGAKGGAEGGAEAVETKDSAPVGEAGETASKTRDERGRFVKGGEAEGASEKGEGAKEPPAAAGTGDSGSAVRDSGEVAAATESGAELEVFGKKYPDIKSAFHALKSRYGQMRNLEEQFRELRGKYEELTTTLEKSKTSGVPANGGVPSDSRSGSGGRPAGSTAEDSAKGKPQKLIDVVDWKFVERLSNDPEYGVAKAMQWALNEAQRYFDDRLTSERESLSKQYEERLAPVDSILNQNAEAREAFEVFSALQSRVNEDGSRTFPLIQDEGGDVEFIREVVTRWKDNPNLRSQGEFGAYLAYLDVERWRQHLGKSLPDAPTNGKSDIEKKIDAQNVVAASAVSEKGGATPLPTGKPARKSFAADFKRSLYEGDETQDSQILGF